MPKEINVVGAVIVRDGRIFAAKRGPGRSMAGFWEFPGGKIEPGETPEQALARELNEELGIVTSVGEYITTSTHAAGSTVISLSTYFCTLQSGEPVTTEHEEIRWVSPDELESLTWAPADIETVEMLKARAQ